jgi:hypothetical protein
VCYSMVVVCTHFSSLLDVTAAVQTISLSPRRVINLDVYFVNPVPVRFG